MTPGLIYFVGYEAMPAAMRLEHLGRASDSQQKCQREQANVTPTIPMEKKVP
jgi:hypothetical protein